MTLRDGKRNRQRPFEWPMPTPLHWRLERLKWSVEKLINGTWGEEPNGVDDVSCVRVTDFDRVRFAVVDAPPTVRAIEERERSDRLLHHGDLLIEKSGGGSHQPVGCVVNFEHTFDAVCSNFIGRIVVAPGMFSRYCTYVHASLYSMRLNLPAIKQTTGIQNLDTEAYFNQRVPFPPLPEQRAIADYLDRETVRIDALIKAKERLLGLLAEKRRALIARAITRGLQPNTPLRDSGIPWLEEIPAHWDVWKLGHTAQIGNGSTPGRGNAGYWLNGTIPWLTSSVVNQYEVTKADEFVTEVALQDCHLPLVKSGSVLVAISGQGMTRGQAAVLSFEATVNQHLAYVETDRSRLDSWFLRWVFLVAYEFLRSISDDAGGTRGALTCADIASFRIPIPPVREQSAIATYVSKQVRKLDELCTVTEKSIALLKERRTALIAAAVTGQLSMEAT